MIDGRRKVHSGKAGLAALGAVAVFLLALPLFGAGPAAPAPAHGTGQAPTMFTAQVAGWIEPCG